MKQSKQIKVKLSWLIITCVLAFILFLTVYYSFLKSEEEITSWVYKGYELHFRADLRRAGEMEVRDERAIHDLLWSDEIENLTIGFSEAPDLGLVSVEAFEIALFFPEIKKYSVNCKFSTCLHKNEPKCEVIAAVESGKISEQRYINYRKILSDFDK